MLGAGGHVHAFRMCIHCAPCLLAHEHVGLGVTVPNAILLVSSHHVNSEETTYVHHGVAMILYLSASARMPVLQHASVKQPASSTLEAGFEEADSFPCFLVCRTTYEFAP